MDAAPCEHFLPFLSQVQKFVLKNERGIFVLSAIRTIFMRLLYNTKYNIIDQNMSDSNVGGRKKMSSVHNIFILNGIIHETLSSKHNTPVTLQVYDYTQMFDSMDLEESVGDLFDSGVKDDTLALLYNANTNIKVRVKTPAGLSEEMNFRNLYSKATHGDQPWPQTRLT